MSAYFFMMLAFILICAPTALPFDLSFTRMPSTMTVGLNLKIGREYSGAWVRQDLKHRRRTIFRKINSAIMTFGVEADTKTKNGAWLPIGSAQSLVGDIPVSVELVGEKLVVWRNGATWSVMRDACPHRLAPLSQGRVDSATGCLECPYHGWQFSSSGACTRIPQLASEQERYTGEGAIDRTGATSYPVRLTGDLIWAFLPLPPGQVRIFRRYFSFL